MKEIPSSKGKKLTTSNFPYEEKASILGFETKS